MISRLPKYMVSFFIIVGLLASSFAFLPPTQALAQPTYGTNSPGGSFTGLGSIATSIPGCKDAIADLFGGGEPPTELSPDEFDPETQELGNSPDQPVTKEADSLESVNAEDALKANSVPTFDKAAHLKLDKIIISNKAIDKSTDATEAATKSIKKKESCLDGLAIAGARIVLRKITTSIIDWINTGYEGAPLFLENPESFFTDIAKEEILAFGIDIGDPDNFPFGRNFMIGAVNQFKYKFATNARYSLNRMIQATHPGVISAQFYSDFNQGGWNAWIGMTQYPQNNPIGFNIMATNALSARLEGTSLPPAKQVQEALRQADGFLGDQRCVDENGAPNDITREQHREYLKSGGKSGKECKRFEYVTPGKVISSQVVYAAGSPIRQIEMADELNESLAAIIDAVLNKFISDLSSEGLKGLTADDNNQVFDIDQSFITSQIPPPGTGASQYLPPGLYQNSGWFAANPDFDITADISQALIDEQRTYLEKLQRQNEKLPVLIKWIYQLDYCIPGPNPNWEADARIRLNEIINDIPDNQAEVQKERALLLAMAESTIPSLPAVTGERDAQNSLVKGANAAILKNIFNIAVNPYSDINSSDTKGFPVRAQVVEVLNEAFNNYAAKVKEIFKPTQLYMPSVIPEAISKFRQISGYQQMLEDNLNKISVKKGVVLQLEELRMEIDKLNDDLKNNAITELKYDEEMLLITTVFARLTLKLASGDDIAVADDFSKQMDDEIEYIKTFLVGTPDTIGSCEWELKDVNPIYKQRQPYPFEVAVPGSYSNFISGFFRYGGWNNTQFDGSPPCSPTAIAYPIISSLRLDFDNQQCGSISFFENLLGIW